LVELLVALTLTVGLAALLLNVTRGTMRLWRNAQDTFSTDTEAKLVLDMLERDLQAALFRETSAAWLAVSVISTPSILANHGWKTSGTIKPSGNDSLDLIPADVSGVPAMIAGARFGLSGTWLRFITTNLESKSASNPGGSQPVAVSYQIARRPLSGSIAATNTATVRYTLFRSAVANDSTLTSGFDLLAANYGSSSPAFPGARSSRSITNPNTADAIASNVIDFGTWLYRRNGAGELERVYPSTAADLEHTSFDLAEFPEVADVMVRLLTEEGANAIEALESASGVIVRPPGVSDSEWWWSVAEAHSRVYVRRIQLKAGPT